MDKLELNELLERKAYWKAKKEASLQKVYHNLVLPWIIVGFGSLLWLVMGWGILASWFWITLSISSVLWGSYWIFKVNQCSKKISSIDKEIENYQQMKNRE
ncbi:MAG: hypothetical protein LBR43_04040 [Spiroplasmataceae bacterium]|jgi:hypothetical protein|nr:hypothetical protein [Spiroplasmataceae bacterium]